MDFPKEGNYPTSHKGMRRAMYEVFGGKCFYTGQPIAFEEMTIDHIIPRANGGADNVYNYVPTTRSTNAVKGARYNEETAIPMLHLIGSHHAPRVVRKTKKKERHEEIGNEVVVEELKFRINDLIAQIEHEREQAAMMRSDLMAQAEQDREHLLAQIEHERRLSRNINSYVDRLAKLTDEANKKHINCVSKIVRRNNIAAIIETMYVAAIAFIAICAFDPLKIIW